MSLNRAYPNTLRWWEQTGHVTAPWTAEGQRQLEDHRGAVPSAIGAAVQVQESTFTSQPSATCTTTRCTHCCTPSLDCNSKASTKWIRFSWITLPLLSTSTIHRMVHTGVPSCFTYFGSIIRFYWTLQKSEERDCFGRIKSSTTMSTLEINKLEESWQKRKV